jgi:hypothetical protein
VRLRHLRLTRRVGQAAGDPADRGVETSVVGFEAAINFGRPRRLHEK